MKKTLTIFLFASLVVIRIHAQNQADSSFYWNPQSVWLAKKAGIWDVIMTLQPNAGAVPVTVTQLEAHREMIGAFCLHETMRPVKGASMPLFTRISDLDYNLNDSRWDYISIDTRITAGIMDFIPVFNIGDSIVSYIYNCPHPGFGPKMDDRGKNVRIRNVILATDSDHELVKQYWQLTDGQQWLAVTYFYTRRETR